LLWPVSHFGAIVGQGGAKADRYSEAPADSASNRQGFAKRVRGGREKSRPRLSRQALKGQNPREALADAGLKCHRDHQALSAETDLETAVQLACLSLRRRNPQAESTVRRFTCGGNACKTCSRGANLRRVNPKSAAGVKENRHGIRGSKPSRG
jgi:hypothetical protein